MIGKRIVSFLIYLVICGICFGGGIILLAVFSTDSGELLRKEINVIMLFADLLFIMKDALHISVGKRLLKLQIVAEDGSKADWRACVIRNLFLLFWPIEGIVLLASGRRIGDYVAKTNVVMKE